MTKAQALMYRPARDSLNPQALALEEAQNEIRLAVKDGLFLFRPGIETKKRVEAIVKKALAQIKNPDLQSAAERSLTAFYRKLSREAQSISESTILTALALLKLSEDKTDGRSDYTAKSGVSAARETVYDAFANEYDPKGGLIYGVPLEKYSRDYINDNIKPVLERMAKTEALDPDSVQYVATRQTLRQRAEREVRWQGHLDDLESFWARGVRLVIISAHADCSERCRPFQGKVFSLDGTTGTTTDGRPFVPIEKAIDIYSKNGKWKNGLFGFNCRHYMVEYKDGFRFPKVPLSVEKREYKITQRQRAMERQVIKWRTEAEMYKNIDRKKYLTARMRAIERNKAYQAYSKANDRAYYPSRVKTL